MLVLISYDISENKPRNKAAKLLVDYGLRVQKSVFECIINETQYNTIKDTLIELIDPQTDRVRIYRLCNGCREKIDIGGWGEQIQDEDFVVI